MSEHMKDTLRKSSNMQAVAKLSGSSVHEY